MVKTIPIKLTNLHEINFFLDSAQLQLRISWSQHTSIRLLLLAKFIRLTKGRLQPILIGHRSTRHGLSSSLHVWQTICAQALPTILDHLARNEAVRIQFERPVTRMVRYSAVCSIGSLFLASVTSGHFNRRHVHVLLHTNGHQTVPWRKCKCQLTASRPARK